jgi:glycosyltransferase involved in cell wall biosynthesis
MLGWVEFEELPDYFAAATVGIFPSDDNLITRSKCPAKLTELMLAEVPVVADDVGQIGEYIVHGESGLLCSPGNTDQFATNISELLRDAHKRKTIGTAAKRRILTQFNWNQVTDSVEEAYNCAHNSEL